MKQDFNHNKTIHNLHSKSKVQPHLQWQVLIVDMSLKCINVIWQNIILLSLLENFGTSFRDCYLVGFALKRRTENTRQRQAFLSQFMSKHVFRSYSDFCVTDMWLTHVESLKGPLKYVYLVQILDTAMRRNWDFCYSGYHLWDLYWGLSIPLLCV